MWRSSTGNCSEVCLKMSVFSTRRKEQQHNFDTRTHAKWYVGNRYYNSLEAFCDFLLFRGHNDSKRVKRSWAFLFINITRYLQFIEHVIEWFEDKYLVPFAFAKKPIHRNNNNARQKFIIYSNGDLPYSQDIQTMKLLLYYYCILALKSVCMHCFYFCH